jgi:hypothetical protein
MNDDQLSNAAPPARRAPARRIRWLVSALMASCTLPIVGAFLPFSMAWMPLLWATITPPFGVMLALAFWVGLGNAPLLARLISGVVGAVYLLLSLITADVARRLVSGETIRSELSAHADEAAGIAVAVALFSGTFMVLRRWWALRPAVAPDAITAPKAQFSILYILILIAGVALLLTLIRASRDSLAASDSGMIAESILGFVVFATNAVCASFAALRPAPIGRSCTLVLLVAYVLGVALSFGSNHDRVSWIMIAFGPIISVGPTAILLGSLLVVRSTGYRLLRKSTTDATHEQPLMEPGTPPLQSTDAAEPASR